MRKTSRQFTQRALFVVAAITLGVVSLLATPAAYAQQHGFHEIRTAVESNNPSMLAINAKLGFVQGPGLVLFEKRLMSDE